MSLMECYSIQVLDTCAFVLGKSFSSKPTLQKDLEHFFAKCKTYNKTNK